MPGAQIASGIPYTQIADIFLVSSHLSLIFLVSSYLSLDFLVPSYLSQIIVDQAKVSPWQPWIKKEWLHS